jgi:hypothetical protein
MRVRARVKEQRLQNETKPFDIRKENSGHRDAMTVLAVANSVDAARLCKTRQKPYLE